MSLCLTQSVDGSTGQSRGRRRLPTNDTPVLEYVALRHCTPYLNLPANSGRPAAKDFLPIRESVDLAVKQKVRRTGHRHCNGPRCVKCDSQPSLLDRSGMSRVSREDSTSAPTSLDKTCGGGGMRRGNNVAPGDGFFSAPRPLRELWRAEPSEIPSKSQVSATPVERDGFRCFNAAPKIALQAAPSPGTHQ
jgi:hypothetical protein